MSIAIKNEILLNRIEIPIYPWMVKMIDWAEKHSGIEKIPSNVTDEWRSDFRFTGIRTGCTGELGLYMRALGRDIGYYEWKWERIFRGVTEMKSDGGVDLPGTNFQIKCSKDIYPVMVCNLIVNQREFLKDKIYIFGLAKPDSTQVILIGWVTTDEVSKYYQSTTGSLFEGCYAVPVRDLNPMNEFPPIDKEKILQCIQTEWLNRPTRQELLERLESAPNLKI